MNCSRQLGEIDGGGDQGGASGGNEAEVPNSTILPIAETKVMGLAGVALCRAMPHTDIVSRRGLTLAAAIARQRLDRALRTVLKVSKKDQLKEDAMPKDVNREKARRTEAKRPS